MRQIHRDTPETAAAGAGPQEDGAATDTGLVCLVNLLQVLGLPADPAQLRHQYAEPGRPLSAEAMVRAARRMDLKARVSRIGWSALKDLPVPAIVEMRSGAFMVLGGLREGKVLLLDALAGQVVAREAAAFREDWTGRVVQIARRARLGGRGSTFDISWFVPAILKYRRLFAEVLIASFFLQLAALVTPLFFQVVIDKVLVHRGLTTLDVLVFALVVVSVFEVVLGGLRTYIFAHTTNRIDVELGARLYRHLLALPLSYFESRQVGQSVARVRELETIRDFITGSTLTLLIDAVFTVVFFAVMWYFSPMLTLIVAGSIPFYVLLAVFVTPVLRHRLEEKFEHGARNQAFLVESVTGMETMKALSVEPQSQRRWEEQLAAYVGASFRTTNLGNIAGQATQLVSKITTALTLYFGALAVVDGALSVGQLVAFNMLASRVTGPILRLAQLWNEFQQARLSVQRLGDILNTPTEPQYNPNRATLARVEGRVVFDQVRFRYRPDLRDVLTDISMDIAPGQVVGIVGPSGSGKSTLAKLVQRMYLPSAGRIQVDGIDLSTVDPGWLRRQVGVVLQENLLFNRSVRENIALADPGMPFERVVEAVRMAGAEEFIADLPEGYDTLVGERGSNLSGGQRQRLAIARALVRNPRILIFDEATSALDYESERIIQQNMRRICAGRTVMIIAHRLSTVRHADRILTLEAGRVVEDGSHDALLRAGGAYARLWRIQSGDSASAA
ncbi:type I secretion system permease/ATPase [Mangrovicoccus algicola]|uniref:Type I secretion system permease/ATPase n=1 Tax=Mangrovicoccus algicola TaxID=2771008 RepID=A0A8J6Z9K0_9RHOB|nr:type I secretion system permease/ATPase [Mangrovicoccus algicola]MBE3638825.1 type I secretion system permease/ATPase [Mangrovicoccus algicola]